MIEPIFNYEVEEILNRQLCVREKPGRQWGATSFPHNYKLSHWTCLKVRRKSDNALFVIEQSTDKGKILYFTFYGDPYKHMQCYIGTENGEYEIEKITKTN